jgi:hypothetical protein
MPSEVTNSTEWLLTERSVIWLLLWFPLLLTLLVLHTSMCPHNYLPLWCLISVSAPGMDHLWSWSAMHPEIYFWHNACKLETDKIQGSKIKVKILKFVCIMYYGLYKKQTLSFTVRLQYACTVLLFIPPLQLTPWNASNKLWGPTTYGTKGQPW